MPIIPRESGIDLVIPVHNSLATIHPLLKSIAAQKNVNVVGTIIVDDGSDRKTKQALAGFQREYPSLDVLENSRRMGFTKSANKGLRASSSPIVFLLNSDTVLGPHSLGRMSEALMKERFIGIVGPLSNAGGFQSIPRHKKTLLERLLRSTPRNPMPSWDDIVTIETGLSDIFGTNSVEVPFLNGFCLGVKQEVLESCGVLDEDGFPDGYGEEIDYCIRAKARGFVASLVPGAYVAHKKSQSYGFLRRSYLTTRGINSLKKLHGERVIRDLLIDSEAVISMHWREYSFIRFPEVGAVSGSNTINQS